MTQFTTRTALLVSLTLCLQFGCGKKESDKATGDQPPAATMPGTGNPTAAAPPAAPVAPAAEAKPATTTADVPSECTAFAAAFETLTKCDKIPNHDRKSMKAGYQRMFDAMAQRGDKKGMIDGCTRGIASLNEAVKLAGC